MARRQVEMWGLSLFASASVVPLSRTVIMPLMAKSPSTSWAKHAQACPEAHNYCLLHMSWLPLPPFPPPLSWPWFSSSLLLPLSRKHEKQPTFFQIAKVIHHCDWWQSHVASELLNQSADIDWLIPVFTVFLLATTNTAPSHRLLANITTALSIA